MGRSFDRGGRSRKQRERGKRRAYQHAERDREAREAVVQAKRNRTETLRRKKKSTRVADVERVAPVNVVQMEAAAPQLERKPVGFFAKVINRFWKKSA